MKIALCSPVSLSYCGGAEKWIANTAKLLLKNGHDVKVYALPRPLGKKNVQVSEILGDIPYHESWHSSIKADVVYFNYQPLIWRLMVTRQAKIAGMHSPYLFQNYSSFLFWFSRLFGGKDLSSFDAVHTVGWLYGNFKHKNIYNITNWVDTSFFKPHQKVSDRFTVLFTGKHREEKGWRVFLDLASAIRNLGYDFDFLCTGNGMGQVKGLGFVKELDLPRIYSDAHLVVYPSSADTFSLTIVEALSSGTPVVTFPTFEHINLGLPLFYAKNTSQLTQCVLKIYSMWKNETGQYKEICSKVRSSCSTYDVKKVFPQIENMFRKVAAL